MTKITPDLLIEAYKIGIFPMANNQDDAKIDFFDQMDKNDPPFFIVNYGKNTKPKNIADFHHHPLHAKELKKKADLLNIKNVIYATGIGIIDKSRQGLVDFIVENLK